MLFNSVAFAVFLPVVFAVYWLAGEGRTRSQTAILLASSYLFYGWWNWRFLALIIFVSALNFAVGLGLSATADARRRRRLLVVAIVGTLGTLVIFKYLGFLVTSIASLLATVGLQADLPVIRLLAPLGISFYTLQILTYPLGVYNGRVEPVRQPLEFFAFACFFPLLLAGPIERAGRLLPQFLEPRKFDPAGMRDGLRQILNGLLKKVVIADNLAPHVQRAFADPSGQDGGTLIIAAVFFAFQVYCDFSGYSDMAIGTGRLFGFSLMQNFRYPFFSRDIGEFWRRWHISLSTWLRDYVFFPLGAGYGRRPRQVLNVMITFLVSGLWHGASWTFVFWGALNGLYFLPLIMGWRLVTYKGDVAVGRPWPSARESLAIFVTFLAVVVGFVFFRAESVSLAWDFLHGAFTRAWEPGNLAPMWPMLVVCAALSAVEWIQRRRAYAFEISRLPVSLRWAAYATAILAFLVFGNFGSREFIYLQF